MKPENPKKSIVKVLDDLDRAEASQVFSFIKSIQGKSKPDVYLKFKLKAMKEIEEALSGKEKLEVSLG